jgi:hypothetical protein
MYTTIMAILIIQEYTISRVSKILLNKFVAHVLGLATDDFVERCGTLTHIDLCVNWRLQFMLFLFPGDRLHCFWKDNV